MSYLTYQGKMIQQNHKYLTKIEGPTISGVIYMNSTLNGDLITLNSLPVITGVKTIKADWWIDSSLGSSSIQFTPNTSLVNDFVYATVNIPPSTERTLRGLQNKPYLVVQVKNDPGRIRYIYDIDAYYAKIVNFELIKGTGSITSVKMNGNTLTPLVTNGIYDLGSGGISAYIAGDLCSIWNIEVVGSNKWVGYPNGNQSSSWNDTVGSINAVVSGIPNTRNLF